MPRFPRKRRKRKKRRKNLVPYIMVFLVFFLLPATAITGLLLWLAKEPPKMIVKQPDDLIKELKKERDLKVVYQNGTEKAPRFKWVLEDHHTHSTWFESYKDELGFFIAEEKVYIIDSKTGQTKRELNVEKSKSYKPPEEYNGLWFNGDTHVLDESRDEVWSFKLDLPANLDWHGSLTTDFKNGQVFAHVNFYRVRGYGWGGKYIPDSSGLYALDAMTGKIRWEYDFDGRMQMFLNPKKKQIYIVNNDSILAINTGTGGFDWDTPITHGVEGFAANKDYVFVSTGRGVFQVYDAESGKMLWEVEPHMEWGTSWDELPATWYGDTVVISSERSIIAYALKDGKKKWSVTFETDFLNSDYDIPTFYEAPFVFKDGIYVKSEHHGWFALDLHPS